MIWSLRELVYHNNYSELIRTNLIFSLFYMPFFYFHYYYVLPKVLAKKRWIEYAAILGLGVAVTAYVAMEAAGWVFINVFDASETALWFVSLSGKLISASEQLLLLMFAATLFFMQKWWQKDRYAKELEKQKLEAELSHLKSQVNPHFVFNTLNTIYHLMDRNVGKARDILLRFSDNLSHQLYDTDKEYVPLDVEIKYLKNYIDIETTRSGDQLKLNTKWPMRTNGLDIAPMLLMPLVENAFKHSKSAEGSTVSIDMDIKKDTLQFNINNTVPVSYISNTNGGIGLTNLRRRLELIYPAQHNLRTRRENGTFQASLTITLHEA